MATIYKFGKTSSERLETCDPRLQIVMRGALATGLMDLVILEGVRSQEKQDQYYREKKSKIRWPNGKHNVKAAGDKSRAVDIAPYISGKASFDHKHCCFMAGIILGIAKALGVNMRWGGNWDMDGEPVTDQHFQDLVHFELV